MDPAQGHNYFTRSKGRYPPKEDYPPKIVYNYEMNLKDEVHRFFGPQAVGSYIDSSLFGKIKID